VRVAAVAPELALADPAANAERIAAHLRTLAADNVSLALFPELCLTGYSCEDLFFNDDLHRACAPPWSIWPRPAATWCAWWAPPGAAPTGGC
jgi:predicted amidohydrolase